MGARLKGRRAAALALALAAALGLAWLAGRSRAGRAAMSPTEGVRVPILMYHSILADPARAGKFVVSPATLESDMLYLREMGYETVLIRDLAAYVLQGVPLPPRPVVLTFDDGCLNHLTAVLPLLEEHDMCAVFSVVGEFCEISAASGDPNPSYAHLTWDDVAALSRSGRAEIANHTYALHHYGLRKGAAKMQGENRETYAKRLEADLLSLQRMLAEKSGVAPAVFTYPYGLVSPESPGVIRGLGFTASLSCRERANTLTRDPSCLHSLGRFNRPAGIGTEAFMQKILGG